MTYTQQGDRVSIEMTRLEFQQLTLILGYAVSDAFKEGNKRLAYRWLAFANDLNATNPNWTPYEIPAGAFEG